MMTHIKEHLKDWIIKTGEKAVGKSIAVGIYDPIWSYVKIQYKLKWGFPHLNLPAAIRLAEAYDTALHNRLVTYNHSDYEFVSYCRMLPNIQKSNDMHDHNLES